MAASLGSSVSFEYPSLPAVVEVNVTDLVNEAIQRKCSYVAFRISAVSENAFESVDKKERLNFGGSINVWDWPESHAPALQLTWD